MGATGRNLLLVGAAVAIPIVTAWLLPRIPSVQRLPPLHFGGMSYPASPLKFERKTIGPEPVGLPLITNVQILDFDGDGKQEILACDASKSCLSVFRPSGEGVWTEEVLIEDLNAPAHVTCADVDGDGDLDIIIAILGNLYPDDSVVGRVELYEKSDKGYVRHVILDDVRRVADVQPGDFDKDGDLDLAVAVFGYARGQVLWLENRGGLKFLDHELLNAPGTIHVPVADYDGDGDLDIAACVTQDEEEIWGFENLGNGEFRSHRLWFTVNLDLGSAGLISADLDKDGDVDLILPAGDNLEDLDAYPQPYHGCYWFENTGNWKFAPRRISNLGGTYAAATADLNADGHLDVVLVSMTNDWFDPQSASVVWLENDGQQNFKTWQIDSTPIHLVTVATGDLNGDGRDDIVAGGLNMRKPFERMTRVSAWLQAP
ncbi:FG-GAP repeat domain-containing protein [Planctomicrobium piriforme]|uniref:Repeat domain-containing protein n=1 Tax=Planctomicrobium piriforme TaxID=1576369 RepID=A0A1I3GJQ9_9PLAN|nr:VCBS repeat-containing protein [Planctomicrobium piriforme]SFI23697.1 Repeat domain-containing protein [Planctomicrobium piriforme]